MRGVIGNDITSSPASFPAGYRVVGRILVGPATNLEDDELGGLNLVDFDLSGADLKGSDLTNTDLKRADLSGANLGGVTWSNTTCPDGTNSDNNGGDCVDNLTPSR